MTPLRVGTFNIRNSAAADGVNAWPLRRSALTETVRRFDPDVVGFQEVLADQQDDLAVAFADYGSVAIHRDDGRRGGEAASVFFRTSRFDLVRGDAFWLSQMPDRPGPPAWDAACTRLCTRAILFDRNAGQALRILNTHLNHVGETAKARISHANRAADARLPHPTVPMGDFNSTEDGPIYAALLAAATVAGRPLTDAYRHVHPAVGQTRPRTKASSATAAGNA